MLALQGAYAVLYKRISHDRHSHESEAHEGCECHEKVELKLVERGAAHGRFLGMVAGRSEKEVYAALGITCEAPTELNLDLHGVIELEQTIKRKELAAVYFNDGAGYRERGLMATRAITTEFAGAQELDCLCRFAALPRRLQWLMYRYNLVHIRPSVTGTPLWSGDRSGYSKLKAISEAEAEGEALINWAAELDGYFLAVGHAFLAKQHPALQRVVSHGGGRYTRITVPAP